MSEALVALYAPYCQGMARHQDLERALGLLATGTLLGERRLRPSGSRRFRMAWRPGPSPLDLAGVALQFEDGPDLPTLDYSFELPSYRLVLWLMDWVAAGGDPNTPVDLPDSFWRWLILGLDPSAAAA